MDVYFFKSLWCRCVCLTLLEQWLSYRVWIIPPWSWFLSRLILSPASTSPSSSAAGLFVWAKGSSGAPGCWRRVVISRPAVKQVIPGARARRVHASSWSTSAPPIQWLFAVAPGQSSWSAWWGVTSVSSSPLITSTITTAIAFAGAGRAGFGCWRWASSLRLLSYWWKGDNATLPWRFIKGRDHAGRAGRIWNVDGHLLGRGWHLLHVGGWSWLGLMEEKERKFSQLHITD